MHISLRTGAIIWLLTVEFFLAQFLAQAFWSDYSMIPNDISLLGATLCGVENPAPDGIEYVCSPLNLVFNAGLAINGILVVLGTWATRSIWPRRRIVLAGLWLLALGGDGAFIAGIFPFNVSMTLHSLGATFALLVGALGFMAIGLATLRTNAGYAIYSILTGVVCVLASVLYGSEIYLGLGRGVMERFAAWPNTLWYMTTGAMILLGYLKPVTAGKPNPLSAWSSR
ncbi:hypothetical protein PSQ90_15940 [Devosia rhodophyticola]|uniref:DUF998 domain-containing protein n=1 Tax=Devosia rhodophyticola TaxID=3026423 RepID=A0ABY7YWI3_9HYPH|nr:DUF998 domain-containing protein [Devosia rhodophyticola]WDR05721.1 hypothetical protein PSQ90_15940 [Devosia rhodophyticola]